MIFKGDKILKFFKKIQAYLIVMILCAIILIAVCTGFLVLSFRKILDGIRFKQNKNIRLL